MVKIKKYKIKKFCKGLTMLELMAAILITSLCAVTLAYITTIKITSQQNVDKQATLISVNGFFSEVYKEFKKSDMFNVEQEDDGTYMSLTFIDNKGETIMYTFSEESGEMRRNNIPIFKCLSANAVKTANNLYMSVKIVDDKLLELNIYK